MYGKIKIGQHDVEMAANAASPYYYRKVFQEDFLALIQEKEPQTDLMQKMAFIMAMQAKHGDDVTALNKLKDEDYMVWLSSFEPLEVLMATEDITKLYFQQDKLTTASKKK